MAFSQFAFIIKILATIGGNVEYLRILILSMIPVTELRGAIPIGMALDLNQLGFI